MAAAHEGELTAELLRTPPAEFVAARNAKVAELKAAGERELAGRIAKLRRRRPAEWALNVVAERDPGVVDAWAELADSVRAAQDDAAAGNARTDLRALLTEWRGRTAAVVAAAPDGVQTGELTALLTDIGGSAEATEALRAGLVGGEPGTPPPQRPARKAAARRTEAEPADERTEPAGGKQRAGSRKQAADEAAADRAEQRRSEAAARLEEIVEQVADAEHQAADAAAAVTAAEAALEAAEAAVTEAEQALEAAEERRRAARHARADAERRQATADERLERERRAHRAAAARLADAEA